MVHLVSIPNHAQIILVSDFFFPEISGGAELTNEACQYGFGRKTQG
jgi:hypothetical protein